MNVSRLNRSIDRANRRHRRQQANAHAAHNAAQATATALWRTSDVVRRGGYVLDTTADMLDRVGHGVLETFIRKVANR